jgi:hypothetical protein
LSQWRCAWITACVGREENGIEVSLPEYWLRRPEPSIAVGILATVWFVVMAVAVGELWSLISLIGAALTLGVTVWAWSDRGLWRDNAERARRGDRPFS